MTSPLPRSTLFPYTTLFRSFEIINGELEAFSASLIEKPIIVVATKLDATTDRARGRKSTRLNSSHTVISYAVFCRKKKNRGSTQQDRQRSDGEGPDGGPSMG